MLPAGRASCGRLADRVASIADIAEPLLGGRAWIRKQPHDRLFISLWPEDTILFPTDHDRSGQPRYRWEKHPDGSEFGYLVEGAEPCLTS